MAQQFVYTMKGLGKVVPPKREILKDIWLSFYPGAKIGVLGNNGAGKSSLMRIMAGIDKEFVGEAFPAADLKIGYLAQEPQLDESKDVWGNVEDGVRDKKELLQRFEDLSMKMGEPMSDDEMNALMEEHGKCQDAIDAANAWDLDREIELAMESLRLPPPDAEIKNLSGGEKRRVALCRLVLERPDMLILDEPTNHLDAESVGWLEHFLDDFPGTVVAVTHDRYFLDNVAGWILELDRGSGIPYEGNYSGWLEAKRKRLESEEKVASARSKALSRELDWVRSSPKARHAKNKARLNRYEEMLAEQTDVKRDNLQIVIPPGPRLGNEVVEAVHVTKAFGDKLLMEDLNFRLPRGGIVGVIGANGAGKTTLFRMIMGEETPDSGEMKIGETVKLAYVDQSRDALQDDNTIYQEISEGAEVIELGSRDMNARAYCSAFNFKGSDQQKKLGTLSGGERNRVHLAKLIKSAGNLLLLDEPTNDLDVDTLRALEEGLLDYPGCAVIISHDRWFLDRIATHILAFEGDSKTVWFEGNYQDYEKDRRRRLGDEANQPKRIQYKRV